MEQIRNTGFGDYDATSDICTTRLVSNINGANKKKKDAPKSKYRGVYPNGKKWVAQLHHDGKPHYLGRYDTEEEAARVYDAAARKQHAERAVCNFELTGEEAERPVEVKKKKAEGLLTMLQRNLVIVIIHFLKAY